MIVERDPSHILELLLPLDLVLRLVIKFAGNHVAAWSRRLVLLSQDAESLLTMEDVSARP